MTNGDRFHLRALERALEHFGNLADDLGIGQEWEENLCPRGIWVECNRMITLTEYDQRDRVSKKVQDCTPEELEKLLNWARGAKVEG